MKHPGTVALDAIEPMLRELRTLSGISERKRGVFYRKSRAFLHFHEDPKGLFADVRDGEWRRLPVTTDAERRELVHLIDEILNEHGV